ncbi:MAG: hypothetical protein AAB646_00925, partial [Patescibacteria group bacterium]
AVGSGEGEVVGAVSDVVVSDGSDVGSGVDVGAGSGVGSVADVGAGSLLASLVFEFVELVLATSNVHSPGILSKLPPRMTRQYGCLVSRS